jgi:hypothetical protein
MKQGYRLPVAILAALFALSLWNAHILAERSRRLLATLDDAEQYARARQWTQAAETMEAGERDWRTRRTYLHVVSRHDASNGADALYRRCILYARAGDELNFLTELETLREQIAALPEMERLSVGNIL